MFKQHCLSLNSGYKAITMFKKNLGIKTKIPLTPKTIRVANKSFIMFEDTLHSVKLPQTCTCGKILWVF